jgi:Ca-activated chloride channel family protein
MDNHPFDKMCLFVPVWVFLVCLLILPLPCRADVTVQLVLDGSGSMWGQLYNQYKIVILKEGIETFLENAPKDLRIGVRAFGLTGGEGCSNTRLLLPPSLNAYQEAMQAVKRMNPSGQAPVIFTLRKGLNDLQGIEGKKVLVLVADGSDSCEKDPMGAIEKLSQALSNEEIHVIGLGLSTEEERSELKLLAAKCNGTYHNVANSSQLTKRLAGIVDQAIREEKERLRLLSEEKARQAVLAERTRLVVEFVSHVPSFFCSGIRVLDFQIDGTPVEGVETRQVACTDRIQVYDQPVSVGEHTITLMYHKDNHGDLIKSRPESFTVQIESGKTTRLECRTDGHLFYWGLDFKMKTTPSP